MLLIQNNYKKTNYFLFNEQTSYDYPKLIDAIEYLNLFVKHQPERLFSDESAYHALIFIGQNFFNFSEEINFEILNYFKLYC